MHLIKNSYEKLEIPFFGALFRTFLIVKIIFAISQTASSHEWIEQLELHFFLC